MPFVELSEVDSSNNYAMRQVQADLAEHGTTVFASYQNQGKGQRGKSWNAAAGENIMMSCILEPSFLLVDNQFFLNIVVSLGCYDFFNINAIDKTSIKWPNDIYWGDRKAGGILIENVLQGNVWRFSIAGMGLNINQTTYPADVPNPVSLKQITGKRYDVINCAKELCVHLENRWQMLKAGKEIQLLEEYNQVTWRNLI